MDHDECAPWCDHDPEHHTENCDSSFCDGYKCWDSESRTRFDVRSQPSITITDTYTKDGKHLGRVMKTEDGTIFEREGPDSSKDVVFLRPGLQKYWNDFVANN